MTLDIIIFVFIVFITFKYYRQGLVKSILYGLSNILTIFSAFTLSKRYAQEFSENFLYQNISTSLNSYIEKNIDLTDSLIALLVSDKFPVLSSMYLGITDEDKLAKMLSYSLSYIIIFILSLIVVSIAFKLLVNFISAFISFAKLTKADRLIGGVIGFVVSTSIICMLVWTSYNVIPSLSAGIFSEDELNNTYITKHIINAQPAFFVNLIN